MSEKPTYEELEQADTKRKQAEEAWRETEERNRLFIENFEGIAYQVSHLTFQPVFFQGICEKITGYTSEDFCSGRVLWKDLILPEHLENVYKTGIKLRDIPGFVASDEYPIRTRDGQVKWVRDIARAIRKKDGVTSFIQGAIFDITERKRAEEALRESERRFRTFANQLPGRAWVVDRDLRVMILQGGNLSLVGLKPDEVVGKTLYEHFNTDDSAHIVSAHVRAVAGETVTYERYHDGLHFKSTISPIRDDSGAIIGVAGLAIDITERKKAEEALRQERERLAGIIRGTNVGTWEWNVQTGETIFNERWAEIVGYTLDEISPVSIETWMRFSHPDDLKISNELLEKHFRGELDYYEFESRMKHKGGDWVWILDRGRVISWAQDGKPLMMMGTHQDINRRKIAEEEREKLHEQLAQSHKMEAIGSLAGGVAHDLNNLLSPILGYGEMLRDDLDPEDVRRESIDEIISAGLRARDLVRQLLAFSRKQILEFKPLNLNNVVAGLERLLRRTIREDIEMKFGLTADAGVVTADIGQIEQVIMNLSVNAADAMPEGGKLTIETGNVYLDEDYTKHHESVNPGEYVMLAVSDSGAGMDEATRERIFDPFFSTKGESGTGLGLATVYGIVKQHGGNIWVYSEPGEGSTFKVYFPVVETAKPEETTSAETIKDLKGSETILIVEDSDQVRRLAESVLKRNGYHVLTAKDGAQALKELASQEHPVSLLLTDVILPGMNGRELYEKIAEGSPSMKVLYMSGYTNTVIAHHGVLDEGVEFIQKPFTVYGLAVKVREVLDQKPRK